MWVWIKNTVTSFMCFRNREEDFDVVSEFDQTEEVYRTQVIYRENREILANYYGSSWEIMEYWHKKGVHIVWEINLLAADQRLGFDQNEPDQAISIGVSTDPTST